MKSSKAHPRRARSITDGALVACIGVLIALAIVATTTLNFDAAEDSRNSLALERVGVQRVQQLRSAFADAIAYRDLLEKGGVPARDLAAARAKVDGDFDTLEAAERQTPLIDEEWPRMLGAWRILRTASPHEFGSGATLFDPLVRAPSTVSDRSRLTTESNQATLDVADAVTYRLPPALYGLYQLRDMVTHTSANGRNLALRLAANSAVVANTLQSAYDDLDEAVAQDDRVRAASAAAVRHAEQSERALVGRMDASLYDSQHSPAQTVRYIDDAIRSQFAVFDALVPVLDGEFSDRIAAADRRGLASLAPGALAIFAEFIVVIVIGRMVRARVELAQAKADIAQAERELARVRAEARYAAIFRNATVGLMLVDRDGLLHDANPALETMLGCARGTLTGRTVFELLDANDVATAKVLLARLFDGGVDAVSAEQRYHRSDGTMVWASTSLSLLRDPADVRPFAVALIADITERKRLTERLVHAATHDASTGLPNRALFVERLEASLAGKHSAPVAVLFVDIDNFKLINDNLGHVVGDAVLREVAERLARASAPNLVARIGGDEFAILLEGASTLAGLRDRTERLLALHRDPYFATGFKVHATLSIGVATAGPLHDRADDLLRDADTAMYQAKAAGRARAKFFDARPHDDIA